MKQRPVEPRWIAGLIVCLCVCVCACDRGTTPQPASSAPPPTPTQNPPPDPSNAAASVTEAQQAIDQQRWSDAIGYLNALLERHPEHAEALALLKKAEDEAKYAMRLEEGLSYFNDNRFDDAELKLGGIPETSFYDGQKQEVLTWLRHAQAFPPQIQRKADEAIMRRVLIGPTVRGSTDEDVTFALALCRKTMPNATCKPQDFAAEQPQRQVYVNTFYIDEAEVSGAQYGRCIAANACTPIDWSFCTSGPAEQSAISHPNLPQVCVTWIQAQAYCTWAGGRLPFEAEWEKAARGPSQERFPWGDLWSPTKANWNDYDENNIDTFPKLAPVRSLEPNGYGLYHMAGNVIEWTHDHFSATYYQQDPPPEAAIFLDPEGPPPPRSPPPP